MLADDVRSAFDPTGRIGLAFGPGYVRRPDQADAAADLTPVIAEGGSGMLDAGTGTGKTLVYLVPAAAAALEFAGDGRRRRTLVLVTTNSLLAQIVERDGPIIERAFPGVRVRGISGVENYVCAERLAVNRGTRPLWLSESSAARCAEIEAWADETTTGLRTELPFDDGAAWSRYATSSSKCAGTACPHAQTCHYLPARAAAETAEIVVSNYALVLSVLSRAGASSWIDGFDVVICDEAHALADEARNHLGWRIDAAHLRAAARYASAATRAELQAAADERAAAWRAMTGRVRFAGELGAAALIPLLIRAGAETRAAVERSDDVETKRRARAASYDLEKAATRLEAADSGTPDGHAYWTEPNGALHAAVLRPGRRLDRLIWQRFDASLLVSATLSTGGSDPYGFVRRETGFPEPDVTVRVESPFDHEGRVLAYVPRSIPDARTPEFRPAAVAEIRRLVGLVNGRVLVICTSRSMVRQVASALAADGVAVAAQGGGGGREELVRDLRAGRIRVLVGSEAVATGLDVPGLDLVVIDRIPFPRPDDPVASTLRESWNDEMAFFHGFAVPRAVAATTQRFGRLMRREDDRGIVAILDRRVVDSQLAKRFADAKPRCRLYRTGRDLADAWRRLTSTLDRR